MASLPFLSTSLVILAVHSWSVLLLPKILPSALYLPILPSWYFILSHKEAFSSKKLLSDKNLSLSRFSNFSMFSKSDFFNFKICLPSSKVKALSNLFFLIIYLFL